ncbi:MAG: hypothetical protein EOM19_08230, partial [Candidatus Moranbacteria bacterium]|nr:hypothetical protein [Candidatus Moranbacteria bacterium]
MEKNNTLSLLNESIQTLSQKKDIASGIMVAQAFLEYMGVLGLQSYEDIVLTSLSLPNAERFDTWFQPHPHFKSSRSCFALNDRNQSSLEAKFYALSKKSRLFISGAVHFTDNFEDALFTRQDPQSKVGIDFFLSPEKDSLIIALSNNKMLRVVEIKDRLTNTQAEIFLKWEGVAGLSDRESIHSILWESFKLKSLNEKFYMGIATSFKDLVSFLEEKKKSPQDARIFANRLHGRLLFCWFLRKKHFINEHLGYFDTHLEKTDTEYYKHHLEILFFETLNQKQERDTYTPYLNGGLFDPQETDWRGEVSFPQGFFKRLYD